MPENFDDYHVGDDVWALAWVGTQFRVIDKDKEAGRISLEAPTATDPRGLRVDIFPDMMFMVTHEKWDQIWYWPDRAGETYDEVYERFERQHATAGVALAYNFPVFRGDILDNLYLTPHRDQALPLRILPGAGFGGIQAQPLVALDDSGVVITEPALLDGHEGDFYEIGPFVPLRLGMRAYRWTLSFGEFVVNWRDVAQRIPGHESLTLPVPEASQAIMND